MRIINDIIVHCTATPEGRPVSLEEVNRWHIEKGFNGIGYHYLILLNGDVVSGRKLELPGAHCEGHNANSIGICYVGGLDRLLQPKDTRTPLQKTAMRTLLVDLKRKFPNAAIHGHRDYSTKACPCFDAKSEYRNL